MTYPTHTQVEREESFTQICRWYRYLPTAGTPQQVEVMLYIMDRYNENGGITPEISKLISP